MDFKNDGQRSSKAKVVGLGSSCQAQPDLLNWRGDEVDFKNDGQRSSKAKVVGLGSSCQAQPDLLN